LLQITDDTQPQKLSLRNCNR